MSDLYGLADEAESIATIHAALDAGVTLLDTGDWYGWGHNEMLLRQALLDRNREDVVISVKFGIQRDPSGAIGGIDNRPNSIKNYLAYTLKRLGTDHVDIYRPSRISPKIPVEDVVGATGELVNAGYVRHIGLSEVGAETLRRAAAVHPISDVQIEYSLISRGIESGLLPSSPGTRCRDYGVRVLSRGLISAHWSKDRAGRPDFRSHLPRFTGENLDRNLALVDALRQIADAKSVTVAQVAIAWVLSRGSDIVPVVGSRRRDRLAEALVALDVRLIEAEVAAIEAAAPCEAVAGTRYDAFHMSMLDSERG